MSPATSTIPAGFTLEPLTAAVGIPLHRNRAEGSPPEEAVPMQSRLGCADRVSMMCPREIPLLPEDDPGQAPLPGEPGYESWIEKVVSSPEGVDRAAIWKFLDISPVERLQWLEGTVNDLLELRGGEWPEIR